MEVSVDLDDLEAGVEVNLRDLEGVKVKAEDEQSSSGVESEGKWFLLN